MSSDDTKSGIQVIARAAAILRALKDQPSGMSLGQIAAKVALPRSTVQRIVAALQTERLVIAQGSGRGLMLGPELGALAEASRYNIVEQCRILLSELSQVTGETADLSVMRGDTMIFLDQVPGTHRLRAISSVGEVFPVTTTANGRACLAKLPRTEAMEIAQQEWVRWNTSPDRDAFSRLLDQIAEAGLAFDTDEHTDGISAVGFAFSDWAGHFHAISVPVPTSRFRDQKPYIVEAIQTTKTNIARMMGQA